MAKRKLVAVAESDEYYEDEETEQAPGAPVRADRKTNEQKPTASERRAEPPHVARGRSEKGASQRAASSERSAKGASQKPTASERRAEQPLLAHFSTPFRNPSKGLLLGDVFSGIGGWELAAGPDWQCVFAAEMEPNARKVWEANHGRQPDVGDILEEPASSTRFAHVFCVSFPCQSSSHAGRRLGRRDPRGGQVLGKALDMIDSARPPLVVFENVKGFKSVQGGAYYSWLENRLRLIGYPVLKSEVLGTHCFGLPQKRERLYMVAFREDCAHMADEFKYPDGNDQATPTASVFLKRRLAKRFVNTIRCGGRGSKDRHAWDWIPCQGSREWYQLSVVDCKRLMGFPAEYKMPVPITQQFRLLGNAVPTRPAAQILRECRRIVLELYSQRALKRSRKGDLD